MKYLAALLIGIGLIAHNPAFAEKLKFRKTNGGLAPMEECIEASKVGYELWTWVSVDNDITSKRYLVRDSKMEVPFRVYTINCVNQETGDVFISCSSRTGEKY